MSKLNDIYCDVVRNCDYGNYITTNVPFESDLFCDSIGLIFGTDWIITRKNNKYILFSVYRKQLLLLPKGNANADTIKTHGFLSQYLLDSLSDLAGEQVYSFGKKYAGSKKWLFAYGSREGCTEVVALEIQSKKIYEGNGFPFIVNDDINKLDAVIPSCYYEEEVFENCWDTNMISTFTINRRSNCINYDLYDTSINRSILTDIANRKVPYYYGFTSSWCHSDYYETIVFFGANGLVSIFDRNKKSHNHIYHCSYYELASMDLIPDELIC